MALELLQQLDNSILFFINKTIANPLFDIIFQYTHQLPYVFWALLIGFFIIRQKHALALLMIIAVVLDLLLVPVLKTAVGRDRPYELLDVRQLIPEDGGSFPSNHTLLSFLLSTIVFSFYGRFGMVLFGLSAFVGIGRIYVGVHYPSDVLAGAILGILVGALILKMKDKLVDKKL